MILTRQKISKSKQLTDGTYIVSLFNIQELNGKCRFSFNCKQGSTKLELDINEKLWHFINQIAFIGGIPQGENITLSDLINLQVSITIKKNKITKINKK